MADVENFSHFSPQQAFWCLVQICEKYLPGYYSAGLVSLAAFLEGKEVDLFVFRQRLYTGKSIQKTGTNSPVWLFVPAYLLAEPVFDAS